MSTPSSQVLEPKTLIAEESKEEGIPTTKSMIAYPIPQDLQETGDTKLGFTYLFEDQTWVYHPGSQEEKRLVWLIDLHM